MPIKRAVILEAIKPEVEKFMGIFAAVFNRFKGKEEIKRGVIVVGGGALLPGLIEKIGLVAGVPIRLGKFNFSFKRELVQEILYLSAIGLAYQGYRSNYPYRALINGQHPWYQDFLRRGKELYEEYF